MYGFETSGLPCMATGRTAATAWAGSILPLLRVPRRPPRHRKDQLKKKDSPELPMPKEVKKAFEATLAALKKGDKTLLIRSRGFLGVPVFVKKQDLLSPTWRDKAVPSTGCQETPAAASTVQPASPPRSAVVSKEARLAIERSRSIADVRAWMASPSRLSREASLPHYAAAPSFRFRDWNPEPGRPSGLEWNCLFQPDNEIACPQLGFRRATCTRRCGA